MPQVFPLSNYTNSKVTMPWSMSGHPYLWPLAWHIEPMRELNKVNILWEYISKVSDSIAQTGVTFLHMLQLSKWQLMRPQMSGEAVKCAHLFCKTSSVQVTSVYSSVCILIMIHTLSQRSREGSKIAMFAENFTILEFYKLAITTSDLNNPCLWHP